MQTIVEETRIRIEDLESDADFVLCSEGHDLISEHCTVGEAKMAFFQEAARHRLGEHLPVIYRREELYWVPLA